MYTPAARRLRGRRLRSSARDDGSGQDHTGYASGAFERKKTVKDIADVTGLKPEGTVSTVFMAPTETKTLGGLDITTTAANDEGVGFFVRVDGVTIFRNRSEPCGV